MKEEPLYAYSDFGDQSDEMRKCLINLFQQNHKYQKAVFKKRFEELMGAVISDVDLTKLLKV